MNKQTNKNRHISQALKHAVDGVVFAFHTERNFRSHCVMSVVVMLLAMILKCTNQEWLWLILSVTLVLVMELLNTIVEVLVDEMTKHHYYDWAKHAKDMAAAMVTLSAMFSLVVGSVILLPKILVLLS